MRKLLCKLGLHSWRNVSFWKRDGVISYAYECRRCSKTKIDRISIMGWL